MHPNEQRNGHQLSMKWAVTQPVALGSDQSSVRSWLVQPIKELSMQQGGVPEAAVH